MYKKGDLVVNNLDYFARKIERRDPRIWEITVVRKAHNSEQIHVVIKHPTGSLECTEKAIRLATKAEIVLYHKKPVDKK